MVGIGCHGLLPNTDSKRLSTSDRAWTRSGTGSLSGAPRQRHDHLL
jgi:hypothetical protein